MPCAAAGATSASPHRTATSVGVDVRFDIDGIVGSLARERIAARVRERGGTISSALREGREGRWAVRLA
jgi:hypothetical protein